MFSQPCDGSPVSWPPLLSSEEKVSRQFWYWACETVLRNTSAPSSLATAV